MLIGYARVSTDDQNLDLQRDALHLAGCEKVYEDRMSGAKVARPGLQGKRMSADKTSAGLSAMQDGMPSTRGVP